MRLRSSPRGLDATMATGPAPAEEFEIDAVGAGRTSLTYWQLVRWRLRRNKYGLFGMALVVLILVIGLFHAVLTPYNALQNHRDRQYYPPQVVHWLYADGEFHLRPFVYGWQEEMDSVTFEFRYIEDPEQRFPVHFFVRGNEWSMFGLEGSRRLFGVDAEAGHYLHLLGTDNLGRDVFSRMLAGTTTTLLMAFTVVMLAAAIGLTVGLCAGYFSGNFDLVMQRITEFMQSFPDLPLYLALLALLPARADSTYVFFAFAGILVLLRWAPFSREIRGMVLAMRGMDYVRAAVAVGAGNRRILFRHIMPNTTSQVIVWVTYNFPEIILLETFLSFLGVGIQQPSISWGLMLNQILDFQTFNAAPWMMAPVGMVVLSVLAFNAFGDSLRDAVDPHGAT